MSETYTAFVIDDDKEMRNSLGVLLERAGWQVTRFSGAKDALERLAVSRPDVVLSDRYTAGTYLDERLAELRSSDS